MASENGSERIYYMDLARAVILISGVFFHSAHIFADTGWLVASTWTSPLLAGFVGFVRGFRMEALFMVSGFFSAVLVTRRGASGFVVNRMVRMGVPLVVCGLVFNTVIALWGDYPVVPWTSSKHFLSGNWMYHLWNIGNLLAYEATMFTLLWVVPSLHGWLAKLHPNRYLALVVYMGLLIVFGKVWPLLPSIPGVHTIFSTGELAVYAPAYLLGYVLHQNSLLRERILDLKFTTVLTALLFLLQFGVAWLKPEWGTQRGMRLQHIACVLLLFSVVKALETRNIWVKRLSIASYSIYILHLPLQIAMYRSFPFLQQGYLAFLILAIVPILVVWAFHVQVVERWGWAGFLINGKVFDQKTRSF